LAAFVKISGMGMAAMPAAQIEQRVAVM
jgi:hypothetical protein